MATKIALYKDFFTDDAMPPAARAGGIGRHYTESKQ
jgi:hypothetical protein